MFIRLRYAVGLLLLFFVTVIWADVAIPTLSHRITDLTATLNAEQNAALENKLAAFEAKKGSQIAVLILPTTQPETIEAFGIRVADSWKIGRKNIDDGVILIVAKDDRKMRIEVGRGLEGAIPDAIAKRVIEEIITPKFKANDFAGGIDTGVSQLLKLIEEEKLPNADQNANSKSDGFGILMFLVFSVVLILYLIFFVTKRAVISLMIQGNSTVIRILQILGTFFISAIVLVFSLLPSSVGFLIFSFFGAFIVFFILLAFRDAHYSGDDSSRIDWDRNDDRGASNRDFGGGGGGAFSGGGGGFSGGGASGSW